MAGAMAPHREHPWRQRPLARGRASAFNSSKWNHRPTARGSSQWPGDRRLRARNLARDDSSAADTSFRLAGHERFRITLHRERGRAAAATRALPSQPPALPDLRFPPQRPATQSLAPGRGRTDTPTELLVVGYGAGQHIRKNQVQHLYQGVTLTRRFGSFTFEESLARLVLDGTLERREAKARATHTEELEGLLRKPPG